MGAQPGIYAKELATAAGVPVIPAISSDDRPLDVLRRRPDVIAAERQVAAANARIGVAISSRVSAGRGQCRTSGLVRPWRGTEFGGAAIACLHPFAGVVATVLTGES
jgi:hypothetical protein